MWKLAALNLFRSKTRSILTLSAIAFGCAALILAAGFIQYVCTEMQESYIRAFIGHIRVVHQGYLEKGLLEPYGYMIKDVPSIIQKITPIQGVIAVAPRLEFPGLLSTGDHTIPFIAQAVQPEVESSVSHNFQFVQGSNLTPQDTYQVILGQGMAEAIGAKPNDRVTLLVTTPRGGINALDLNVKGVFHTISKEFDDHALRMVLATGQKLLRKDGVHTITVFLSKTADTDRVRDQLQVLFKQDPQELEVKPWYALSDADFVVKVMPFYSSLFAVLRIIIITMVVFGIFNTINTSVLERIGEIGTIGALGARKLSILKLFLTEGFLLGASGAALGLVVGLLLAGLISWIGIPMPTAPGTTMECIARIQIVPSACFSACLLVISASLLSTLFPAYKATQLEIADALRHNV